MESTVDNVYLLATHQYTVYAFLFIYQ